MVIICTRIRIVHLYQIKMPTNSQTTTNDKKTSATKNRSISNNHHCTRSVFLLMIYLLVISLFVTKVVCCCTYEYLFFFCSSSQYTSTFYKVYLAQMRDDCCPFHAYISYLLRRIPVIVKPPHFIFICSTQRAESAA